MSVSQLTSRQEVCGLYRRAIKLAFDWILDKDEYRKMVIAIRREFERNKTEQDPERIALLKRAGMYVLWKYRHPEPYVCNYQIIIYCIIFVDPTAPGGVAYEREVYIPQKVTAS